MTDTGRPDAVVIETGYVPGLLARCIAMHARYYSRESGFGKEFEGVVAGGLAGFAPRLDRECNEMWRATRAGRIVGTIAIDGEDLGGGAAHLRWFIVEDGLRGAGVGRALLSAALDFADREGFPETRLWTFKGLDAARKLYESHGFTLAREYLGSQWGREVMEQEFVRPGPPSS